MTAEPGEVFAVNTYSWIREMPAAECLRRLADRGYRAFEVMAYPGHLWPDELDGAARRDLRRLLERDGLRLMSLNMPNIDINLAAASPGMRRHSLDELSAITRLAGELGAEGMIVGPGKANPLFPPPPGQLIGHFYRALDRLGPVAEAAGTALWVENMPFAFLPGMAGLMDAVDAYGNDAIGICYDVANAHFIGENLAEGVASARPRLKLVHLSDTGQGAYRHDRVGDGTVPFSDVPSLLAGAGHDDPPVLEIISTEIDADLEASALRLLEIPGWPSAVRGG